MVVPTCEDDSESGSVRCAAILNGELRFLEYWELPDHYDEIARTEQGLLARLFGELLTDIYGEDDLELLQNAAVELGFNYLDELRNTYGMNLLESNRRVNVSVREERKLLGEFVGRIERLGGTV